MSSTQIRVDLINYLFIAYEYHTYIVYLLNNKITYINSKTFKSTYIGVEESRVRGRRNFKEV